ncbi:MAG: LuxR C-terminal-related transcriptional regulator [Actinomycetaceae bacterium]
MTGMPRVSVGYRMPEPAAALLDPLPGLVLVHAPRGWGKTSLMASRLSAESGHTGPVHWAALGEGALTADDVRSRLDALVEQAGDQGERPTLVLDNVSALDGDTTDLLLETAEAWDGPNLVLISRTSQVVVGLAPLAPDSVIITGQHLKIDAARTVEIGSRMGVDISLAHAARLVDDFAGWPGLLRGALFGEVTGGSGAVNYDVLVRLSTHVMSDFSAMTDGGFAGLMLPELITDWVTDELFGGADASAVVRRVEGLGIVRPEPGGYAFAAGIRRVGLRAFREAHPDHLKALAQRLQVRAGVEGEVRAELLLAAEAEDWDTAAAIVHARWEHLVRNDPDALHRVARRAPDPVVADDARLRSARELLGPDGVPGWLHDFMSARIPAEPPAADMTPFPRADAPGTDALEWRKTLMLLAISRLRDADGVTATVAAHQALKFRPRPGDDVPPWTSDDAVVAVLALALTLVGNTSVALRWVERSAGISDRPPAESGGEGADGAAVETVTVAGVLVRVTDELDRLGPVAAMPAGPSARGSGSTTADLWQMLDGSTDPGLQGGILLSLTAGALLQGDCAAMLAEVERRAIGARSATEVPVARVLMHACAADLCLALGHTTAAQSWLDSANAGPHSRLLLEPATVRLMLARGDDEGVLRRTEDLSSTVAPRYALELWLGRAAAAQRSGLIYVLSEAVTAAVELAIEHRLVRPFLMLPRDVVQPIHELARPLLGDLDVEMLDTHPGVFPAPVGAVRLTARELEVLTELADGSTVPGIARKYVVAPSTIRTHTSSLYRKLGVSTRAAAIERARGLGLL